MNLLGIGLDRSILADGPSIGDLRWRQQQYARALDQMWYVIYTRRDDPARARQVDHGLSAYPTRSAARWLFPLDAYRIARRVAATNRVDLVTAQDPFGTGLAAYWLKRRCGTPMCVQIFSSFFDNPVWRDASAETRVLHRLGAFIVRRADTVRVESAIERETLIRMGVAADRIWVIPLMVDLDRFRRADGSEIRARYPGRRIVLYAGRLAVEKNLPLLISAAARAAVAHPEMLLVVVGDGPERSRLESLASETGLTAVVFAGVVPSTEMPQYFAACDAFVLPSAYEGIPTVLIEAAAAGKPAVSTPLRNVTDVMIPGETGFVADPTPEAVADRVGYLLAHPDEARAMGRRAQILAAARYDPVRVFADLRRLWEATARAAPRR